MHVVIDENIAFAREVFSLFGEVTLLHGREITDTSLRNADALVVRSITQVNRELLEGTPVRFVGTATIGTDHVNKAYLAEAGIAFADAKGCNADAVTEYIVTAVFRLLADLQSKPEELSFGIIGCGNIGGRLAKILPVLGFTVVKNDPPLERAGQTGFSPLDEILQCDIITCHTPLNRGGKDNTFHLLDRAQLQKAKNLKLLLNASRGEVLSGEALLQASGFLTVLDVWENEPAIDTGVLSAAKLASPHIAGYTYEGKVNGTKMMYDALRQFSGLYHLQGADTVVHPLIEPATDTVIQVDTALPVHVNLAAIFRHIYDIDEDTRILKASVEMSPAERGKYFDRLRKDYKLRREFTNYTVRLNRADENLTGMLHALRFTTVTE